MTLHRHAEEAIRRAEKAHAAGAVAGAHVVRVVADEEAGDFDEPEPVTEGPAADGGGAR